MNAQQFASLYLELRATPQLLALYRAGEAAAVRKLLIDLFGTDHFDVLALPSLRFRLLPEEGCPSEAPPERNLQTLIVALRFDTIDERELFLRAAAAKRSEFVALGVDLPAHPLDHWCPLSPADSTFGTRSAARALVGAADLPPALPERRAAASPVNVVVVDQGFDRQRIPGGNYGGGWAVDMSDYGLPPRLPGMSSEHGDMMVRSIRNLAPEARLFDLPIIPPTIDEPALFLHLAHAAFQIVSWDIGWLQQFPRLSGPWLLVNAWGVLDRRWESGVGGAFRYSDNPNHPFNLAVVDMIDDSRDVIFAAGNCGQFCPSRRCGPGDIGPHNSILGANSLARVITAGAVRSDATWIGLSSQGPGAIAANKPDICAPSHFAEDHDAQQLSTGTSAASAMTAGVIAALRAYWDDAQVTPDVMGQALRDNARKVGGNEYDGRYGHGVLDVAATVEDLANRFPAPPV